jgi:hypothetical protein
MEWLLFLQEQIKDIIIIVRTGDAGFWRTEAKRELSKFFELCSMFVPCDTH